MIIGWDSHKDEWRIYTGETGGTFGDRFTTHKNTEWYKALDPKNLLFLVIDVPEEKTIDFRKTLEYQITIEVVNRGITPLNIVGNSENIASMTDNLEKLSQIASLALDYIELYKPNIYSNNIVNNKVDKEENELKTDNGTKYPVGTLLRYSHTKFGAKTTIEASVVNNNKVVITNIANAPLKEKFSETAIKDFSRFRKIYDALLLEADVRNGLYSWSGTSEPLPVTTPLALARGISASSNQWEIVSVGDE